MKDSFEEVISMLNSGYDAEADRSALDYESQKKGIETIEKFIKEGQPLAVTVANAKKAVHTEQGLWIKQVEHPALKPLNQWRDELFGYWMVVTDSDTVDGKRMARAVWYGTDREKLLDIWSDLCSGTDLPTAKIICNKRSNWMGGAFIVKAGS